MVSTRGTYRYGQSRFYKPGTKKGVMVMYGHTGTRDSWFDLDISQWPNGEMSAVADAGFPIASCDTGTDWGNSIMRARMSAMRTEAQAAGGLFASGKVHLVGVSAGGLSALNWAKNNPTLVQSITLLIPAINPRLIATENRGGFTLSLVGAYGGAIPTTADNPTSYAGTGALPDVPMRLYYSTDDLVTTAAESTAFAAAEGAEAFSMGAMGHFWGPPWSGAALADFIKASD